MIPAFFTSPFRVGMIQKIWNTVLIYQMRLRQIFGFQVNWSRYLKKSVEFKKHHS